MQVTGCLISHVSNGAAATDLCKRPPHVWSVRRRSQSTIKWGLGFWGFVFVVVGVFWVFLFLFYFWGGGGEGGRVNKNINPTTKFVLI